MTVRTADGRPGRLASIFRSISERSLHPWRRRRARARLEKMPPPRSVVFICKDNLVTSPFAAACLAASARNHNSLRLRIASAGFVRPGRIPPADAQECARRFGAGIEQHRSRLVAELIIGDWDLFVVLDQAYGQALRRRYQLDSNRILVLGDLDPAPGWRRAIEDSDVLSPDRLETTYARIARCTDQLSAIILG